MSISIIISKYKLLFFQASTRASVPRGTKFKGFLILANGSMTRLRKKDKKRKTERERERERERDRERERE